MYMYMLMRGVRSVYYDYDTQKAGGERSCST